MCETSIFDCLTRKKTSFRRDLPGAKTPFPDPLALAFAAVDGFAGSASRRTSSANHPAVSPAGGGTERGPSKKSREGALRRWLSGSSYTSLRFGRLSFRRFPAGWRGRGVGGEEAGAGDPGRRAFGTRYRKKLTTETGVRSGGGKTESRSRAKTGTPATQPLPS